MASIAASPTTIPPGGTTTLTVSGLAGSNVLQGTADLVKRETGAVEAQAQIQVSFPGETVGLESEAGTTYFVRVSAGFSLMKMSPTQFHATHTG